MNEQIEHYETTLVDETEQLTEAQASRLTKEIRKGLSSTHHLIRMAWEKRAWVSLGYESWDAYCSDQFGDLMLTPPKEDRTATVAELSESGMSLRAIASATDLSKNTAARLLKQAEDEGLVDAREDRVGVDGKVYASPKPKQEKKASAPAPESEASEGKLDELDESMLDMDADDIGIEGFTAAPETVSATPDLSVEDALEEITFPGMETAEDTVEDHGLEEVIEKVKAAEISMKSSLEASSMKYAPEEITDRIVGVLTSSLLASAGMLDCFRLNQAPITQPSMISKHLEVAVATLDRVVEQLRSDADA
ncbi:winged helix-turn-helix domain-containing protein [Rothia sp. AR01]|uniref:Winged helix-turn-helix domain-containing protein n=1 Tax=Rothia santali TaxID=2949643 RepID=A0A9X2KIG2_9MICC|nr:winged helix-turn-helix domain-containing protein [Rothia santali]MCP3425814.1 winged helix-turn-helix domain-containing protein [Rothia santali]